MSDTLARLAILLLRPVEIWHERRVRKLYRKGKFRPPADGRAAVTTRYSGSSKVDATYHPHRDTR